MSKPIKYLEGSYKIANEKGVLSAYVFYLKLKSLDLKGGVLYKCSNLLGYLNERVYIPKSQLASLLKQAVSAGFLVDTQHSYRVVAYDKIFTMLGYTIGSPKCRYNGVLSRRIFKICCNTQKEFKTLKNKLQYTEMKWNVWKQTVKAISHAKHDPDLAKHKSLSVRDMLNANCEFHSKLEAIRNAFREQFWHQKAKDDQFVYEFAKLRAKNVEKRCNPTVGLSCIGIGSLLGYTSSRSGFLIQKKLERLGWVNIQNRVAIIDHCTFEEYRSTAFFKEGRFFFKDNKIYRQLINDIEYLC